MLNLKVRSPIFPSHCYFPLKYWLLVNYPALTDGASHFMAKTFPSITARAGTRRSSLRSMDLRVHRFQCLSVFARRVEFGGEAVVEPAAGFQLFAEPCHHPFRGVWPILVRVSGHRYEVVALPRAWSPRDVQAFSFSHDRLRVHPIKIFGFRSTRVKERSASDSLHFPAVSPSERKGT